MTGSAAVTLNVADQYMLVQGLAVEARGIKLGLSPIKFTFTPGTTNLEILAELDLFGISPAPKIACDATVAFVGPDGPLQVTSISGIKLGTYEPSLSPTDLDAIADVLNQILDASGLSVSSPGGDLTGIDLVFDGPVPSLEQPGPAATRRPCTPLTSQTTSMPWRKALPQGNRLSRGGRGQLDSGC